MKKRTLEDVLKDKFSEHELPASPGAWKNILDKLNSRNNMQSSWFFLLAASVAGIALVVSLFFYSEDKPQQGIALKPATVLAKKEMAVASVRSKNTSVEDISRIETSAVALEVKKKNVPTVPELSLMLYKTALERKDQMLPDSSMVSLNSSTEIEFRQTPGKFRKVNLKGEAYFHVKNIHNEPFKIYSGKAFVEVVGTSFNIKNHSSDSIEVIVEEGKVKFGSNDRPEAFIYLVAGERGFLGPDGVLKIKGFEPNELAWKTGVIRFNKTKMSQAVHVLEDYFKIKIRVSDPSVLNCHVTAQFKHPDLDKVLDLFAALIKIKYEKHKEEYILTGKGCD